MLAGAELGRAAAEPAAYVNQVYGVEGAPAVVALVAAGVLVAAVRAGALHVAVGQEALVHQAVGRDGGVFVDVALLEQLEEEVLHDAFVDGRGGVGEEVVGEAHGVPEVDVEAVHAARPDRGGDVGVLGGHHNRGAVHVAAGHHEHAIALHAMVAREDVGRQVGARDVAQVAGTACIGPCDGYKYLFGFILHYYIGLLTSIKLRQKLVVSCSRGKGAHRLLYNRRQVDRTLPGSRQ